MSQYVRLTERTEGMLAELGNGEIHVIEFVSPTGMGWDKSPRINNIWYRDNGHPNYWHQGVEGLVVIRILEKENIVPFKRKASK